MDDARTELMAESNPTLVGILKDEISIGGPITFARFMELALVHPKHGYYLAGAARAGFEGDFLTGPETHPIFGAALARQIAECWDRLGQPESFVVREAGAGAGTLARDIMRGLVDERPDVLAALRYELDDVSSVRVADGLARLANDGFGVQVAAASDRPFTGVLLANELLDAFPVHRLIVQDGDLREMRVAWRDGWFKDEVLPLSEATLGDSLIGLELAEKQRLEVCPAAQAWIRGTGSCLEQGFAILIDYGYPALELYDARVRFDGTLRTYSQHLVSDDPYRRVGYQDLTAHVDFTAMSRAAEAGGVNILGLTSQAFFFAGLGIEELLMKLQTTATDPADYLNARETIMHLMEPHGMGRFRVLALGKGVLDDPPLRGMSFVLR